ncbi:MAG: tetratricopeptide repeat protein [Magnetococcales bacterium]|nr:tetratricopeptide repeat protein [Magnetococcales bacterium]
MDDKEKAQLTVDSAYVQALEHFFAQNYPKVDKLCTAILQTLPQHVAAINLLGFVAQKLNCHNLASEQFQKAINIDNTKAVFYYSLATSLTQLGRKDEAIAALNTALVIQPGVSQITSYLNAILQGFSTDDEDDGSFAVAQEALQQGIAQHQQGQINEAIVWYQRALTNHKDSVAALVNLGVAWQTAGELDKAAGSYQKALAIKPDLLEALYNLGNVLKAKGELTKAVKSFQQAIAINPEHSQAHFNMGTVYKELGDFTKAVASYQKAIAIAPDFAEAYYTLANCHKEAGDLAAAVTNYKKAIEIKADYAQAHSNLGNVLKEQGDIQGAIKSYKNTIAIKQDFVEAHYNLGVALQEEGDLAAANSSYQTTISLKPDFVEAYSNLGVTLLEQGKLPEALNSLQKAIAIKPDYAQAHSNLGNVYKKQDELEKAVESYRTTIAINPNLAEVHFNLGITLKNQGKVKEAVSCYQKALAIKPDFNEAHCNLIFCLDYSSLRSSNIVHIEREKWAKIHAEPLKSSWTAFSNNRDKKRKLRIGYVGADFKHHSAAHIFSTVLLNHNLAKFQIYIYAGNTVEDDLSQKFKNISTKWLSTANIDDGQLAEIIKQDGIDILVDLAGHTEGNRLRTFARKPAPIQITAWGYPLGTSMTAMDYLFADQIFIPAEERKYYKEEIVDLTCMVSFIPFNNFPEVTDPPICKNGYVTFGSFNRLEKYNQEMYTIWSEILHRVPNSKLLFKTGKLDSPVVVEEIEAIFEKLGITKNRLILLGRTSRMDHIKAHSHIDIMLDPYPHTGGVTTLEALKMGVPVLTCEYLMRSPTTACVLHTLDMDEWRVQDGKDYVEKAVLFAKDIDMLKSLRKQLRNRFDESVIGNPKLYVAEVETVYRKLWQKWCDGN